MQSFKQYVTTSKRQDALMEDLSEVMKNCFVFYFAVEVKGYTSKLSKVLKKKFNNDTFERLKHANIDFYNSNLESYGHANGEWTVADLTVWIEITKSYSNNDIIQLADKIIDILQQNEVYSVEDRNQRDTPFFPVVTLNDQMSDNISIDAGQVLISGRKIKSLHNIHKFLRSANEIHVFQSDQITSSVLGLLQVKKVDRIAYREVEAPWLEIIIDAFKKRENLLDVQDHLIDAGLQNYAKL